MNADGPGGTPVGRRPLAVFLATAGGLGFAPFASGTWGTLATFPLALAAQLAGGRLASIGGCLLVTAIGWWATARALPALGGTDPGEVVVDEVAGQWLCLLFLPLDPRWWLAGFLVFRAFDVLKVPPAGRLEKRHGASGIMLDDLAAGLWAGVVLGLAHRILGWAG